MESNSNTTRLQNVLKALVGTAGMAYMGYQMYKRRQFLMYEPPKRIHVDVATAKHKKLSSTKPTIKVLSYNILADIYTDMKHGYQLNRDHLDFKSRSDRIKKEIEESNSDIICLQEVDNLHHVYETFLRNREY